MPFSLSISPPHDRQWLARSFILKISAIMSFTLVLDTFSPLAVCNPPVKNISSQKRPAASALLADTARLTVVS